jgi:hypothetical protein
VPGSFPIEDLGASPDRIFTGWLTRDIARLRHDHSFTVVIIAPEQLDSRGSRLSGEPEAGHVFHPSKLEHNQPRMAPGVALY